MARTTTAAVIGILLDAYDSSHVILPFIESASAIVDEVEECAAAKGQALTTAQLEVIERWVAAHLYISASGGGATAGGGGGGGGGGSGLKRVKTGDAEAEWFGAASSSQVNLRSTQFGQTATLLDPSGCLASIAGGERKRMRAIWLGRNPSNQTDYVDRR